jgi:Fe-S-cluster containining protein
MIIDCLEKCLYFLKDFDSLCPKKCCKCEEMEPLVLLPEEARYWNYPKSIISKFRISLHGFHFLTEEDHHCPFFMNNHCSNYQERPIDCRMFPLYPIFCDSDSKVGSASTYCPKVNYLPENFKMAVMGVTETLSQDMPIEWKVFYNHIAGQEVYNATPIK